MRRLLIIPRLCHLDSLAVSIVKALMPSGTARRFENICDDCIRHLCSPAGIIISTFSVLAAGLLLNPPADPDLFARVAVGRLISRDGVYLFDPFAFTPRKPLFIDHEWFAGYLFYWITRIGGDRGIVFFSLFTVFLSIWFLHRAATAYLSNSRAVFSPCFFFGVLQCGYIWGSFVRSQVITYLFLPVIFLGIALFERKGDRRVMLLFPLIMLVWANSHGGFVTGFAFTGLYLPVLLIRREWNKAFFTGIVFMAMLAVTAVNPYGPAVFWSFVVDAVSMPRPSISEWRPLLPDTPGNFLNYLYFSVVIAGIFLTRGKLLPVLFLAVSLWQGIAHMRLLAIPSMAAMVFFEEEFEAAARKFLKVPRAFIGAFAFTVAGLTIAAACFALFRTASLPRTVLDYSAFPVEATEWLRTSGLKGNLLVDFNKGSFAMWRLYPRFLISLDGRYEEVYPEETVRSVSEALEPESEGFLKSFEEIAPDFVLLGTGEIVRKALSLLPHEWRVFKSAGRFTVLGKGTPPPPGPLMPENGENGVDTWKPLF